MNIAKAVLYLYPDAEPMRDFIVQDDGDGQYIAAWNIDGPRPTNEALAAAFAAWEAEQAGKPPLLTPEQKIAQLEAEKNVLEAQVTQLNGDFAGFIDFYFTNNPEQA